MRFAGPPHIEALVSGNILPLPAFHPPWLLFFHLCVGGSLFAAPLASHQMPFPPFSVLLCAPGELAPTLCTPHPVSLPFDFQLDCAYGRHWEEIRGWKKR